MEGMIRFKDIRYRDSVAHSDFATRVKTTERLLLKVAFTNMFKASLAMVAGWLFAGWLLFLVLATVTLVSPA